MPTYIRAIALPLLAIHILVAGFLLGCRNDDWTHDALGEVVSTTTDNKVSGREGAELRNPRFLDWFHDKIGETSHWSNAERGDDILYYSAGRPTSSGSDQLLGRTCNTASRFGRYASTRL